MTIFELLKDHPGMPEKLRRPHQKGNGYISGYNQALSDLITFLESVEVEVDESQVYKVLSDIGFRWKENAMKGKKQSENIFIDQAKAFVAHSKEIWKVKEKE